MLDAHAHVMQVKLCKANTRGVTVGTFTKKKEVRVETDQLGEEKETKGGHCE